MCSFVPLLLVISHTPITNHLSHSERIKVWEWKRDTELAFGLVNLDIYLLGDKAVVPSGENSQGVKAKLEKLERANCLSLADDNQTINF